MYHGLGWLVNQTIRFHFKIRKGVTDSLYMKSVATQALEIIPCRQLLACEINRCTDLILCFKKYRKYVKNEHTICSFIHIWYFTVRKIIYVHCYFVALGSYFNISPCTFLSITTLVILHCGIHGNNKSIPKCYISCFISSLGGCRNVNIKTVRLEYYVISNLLCILPSYKQHKIQNARNSVYFVRRFFILNLIST